MIEPVVNQPLIASLLALLLIAVASDSLERRIPNLLVVAGLALGLAGHAWFTGAGGLMTAAFGLVVGFLCLLPFYVSGGMGAGDVKLMAMCGAFLGPLHVAVAAVASLLVGGVLGILWLFYWLNSADDHHIDDRQAGAPEPRSMRAAAPSSIPFSLAIGAGVIIALKAAPIVTLTLKGGVPS